jgi:hypothetical protein
MDSSDISIPSSGSRLLSESSGENEPDLSLSDLSIGAERARARHVFSNKPFDIIGAINPRNDNEDDDEGQGRRDSDLFITYDASTPRTDYADTTVDQAVAEEGTVLDEEHDRKDTGKSREEKLQHDLFVLKKINASFGAYREALRSTQSANEVRAPSQCVQMSCSRFPRSFDQRVAAQLEQTDALLNKYMGILSKSEDFSRLVFDEQWYGAQQVSSGIFNSQDEVLRPLPL